ncbi:MAG: FdrA protein [Actinomycetota bacterium]|jgi:FdrA protein|nr:FdrA protein [Actinomycetota bacterium]
MSERRVLVRRDRYVDSVVQMSASRAMMDLDGVEWAAAAMGTPANLETLAGRGFDVDALEATANDCFLAVQAVSDEAGDAALDVGEAALAGGAGRGAGGGDGSPGTGGPERPRSFREAVEALGGAANLAIVSVPGDYAALEAHKALSAGLHVLLFSDNVSLEEEVELKERAEGDGLLVMGPGAGTAMLGRTGLGFANVVAADGDPRPGVGVVAAAGTGAQEVMALLDRGGARVTAVIGVGGRDLSETVGGRMAKSGLRALGADPGTDAVLLVSKPPSEAVARAVLAEAGGKPAVAALIGLAEAVAAPDGVRLASTLEGGVTMLLAALGLPPIDLDGGLRAAVTDAVAALPAERTLVRGLFSGGTLCYEALVILSGILGPVYSNTPIRKDWGLPAPDGAHVCLDLGEEEFTRGRPHPMIDPEARIEHLRVEGARADVAVVLLDVVLGYGAHDDPAGRLAPVCADIRAGGRGPAVVAYVLGTDGDPQGLAGQRAALEAAGCIVPPTAGRAALAAAALAARRPDLVEEPLS